MANICAICDGEFNDECFCTALTVCKACATPGQLKYEYDYVNGIANGTVNESKGPNA